MADAGCVRPRTRQSQRLGRTEGCPLASAGGPGPGSPSCICRVLGPLPGQLPPTGPRLPGGLLTAPLCVLRGSLQPPPSPPQRGLCKFPRETSHMCVHCEPPAFAVSALVVVEGRVVTALACALWPPGLHAPGGTGRVPHALFECLPCHMCP
ncbi:unnamed protein product [Rangifer tarandus platyrhynchus]|uniref:Uncharacterized protein n=2 Tax=Rangifer tarandus platyrhynchus TaxID=3082113 RepID=A0ABN8XTH4_RANTA|nr:unnamed protein product [Rangifer tarandus platyrhynchus]